MNITLSQAQIEQQLAELSRRYHLMLVGLDAEERSASINPWLSLDQYVARIEAIDELRRNLEAQYEIDKQRISNMENH